MFLYVMFPLGVRGVAEAGALSLLRSVVSGGKLVAVRGESVPLSYVLLKVDVEEESSWMLASGSTACLEKPRCVAFVDSDVVGESLLCCCRRASVPAASKVQYPPSYLASRMSCHVNMQKAAEAAAPGTSRAASRIEVK